MEKTEARLRAAAIELDAERQALGLTYQDVADRIGVEKMTAHRYLRGRNGVPSDFTMTTLMRLADAVGLSFTELLDRTEKRASKLRGGNPQ